MCSFDNASTLVVPKGKFYVLTHSSFYADDAAGFFDGKSFAGRAAIVALRNANHYAPGNFVTTNENQRPVCVRFRPPPEDVFTTTRIMQNRVIESIAETVRVAYDSNVAGEGLVRMKKLKKKRRSSTAIDGVSIL